MTYLVCFVLFFSFWGDYVCTFSLELKGKRLTLAFENRHVFPCLFRF